MWMWVAVEKFLSEETALNFSAHKASCHLYSRRATNLAKQIKNQTIINKIDKLALKMTSYTTLVNVDAEAAHKLSEFVAQLLPVNESQQFFNDCKSLIDALNTPALISKLLEQTKLILSIEEESGEKFN